MKYEFSLCTDTGLQRANNEDSIVIDESRQVAVLADGMGGYNAGEVASGMATAFISAELSRWLAEAGPHAGARDVRRAMEICVDNANRAIYSAANTNPQYSGMGTTLVLAVFLDERVLVGHVGDSRCYRWRGAQLGRVTRDHSLLQEQIDAGLITPQQAAVSVHRNLVTRALGVDDTVRLEVSEHRVEPGDLYLLCSDGLTDMVHEEAIAGLMDQEMPLQDKARALVARANAQGGRDNISVILAQAGEADGRRGLISRLLGKPGGA
jgi:protein phosphatase